MSLFYGPAPSVAARESYSITRWIIRPPCGGCSAKVAIALPAAM